MDFGPPANVLLLFVLVHHNKLECFALNELKEKHVKIIFQDGQVRN